MPTEQERLPMDHCLNCGHEMDVAIDPDDPKVRPNGNDAVVCLYCGHIMAFDVNVRLRELTDDEMIEIAGSPQLQTISEIRKQWEEEKQRDS